MITVASCGAHTLKVKRDNWNRYSGASSAKLVDYTMMTTGMPWRSWACIPLKGAVIVTGSSTYGKPLRDWSLPLVSTILGIQEEAGLSNLLMSQEMLQHGSEMPKHTRSDTSQWGCGIFSPLVSEIPLMFQLTLSNADWINTSQTYQTNPDSHHWHLNASPHQTVFSKWYPFQRMPDLGVCSQLVP